MKYTGDSSSTMRQSVEREDLPAIIGSFPIEAYSPDSSAVVVDMTDYILSNTEVFSFDDLRRSVYYLSSLVKESSYISEVKSFKENVEVKTIKTYTTRLPVFGGGAAPNDLLSFEINTSIVMLPDKPMRPRQADERVGYFSISQDDYDVNANGLKKRIYIKRWRLEPKPEDVTKYRHGELVEPIRPIVFYIDPATPAKWVPYLMQGVNDWKGAFEQAGFKNAISAKLAPSTLEDSTWSLFDARNSAIVYKASPIENAMGPSIADPRTGEILESHVNWYHNVIELLHDWYMVQCGATDTSARKMVFSDSLMGKLIQYVCSHEIGHTLGLTHNMGASSSVPVDSLRSKNWLVNNGLCPSIMDYARFNYVIQPGDSTDAKCFIGRIGPYDKWAIEWGYKYLPQFASEEEESLFLNALTAKKREDPQLWFSSEHAWDPRSQTEDLGDDAIKASRYGIENLKRIVPHLIEWTRQPNEGYSSLERLYNAVIRQYRTYLFHVSTNIQGGMYENLKNSDQPGPIYTPLDKNKQKKAMRFLLDQIFTNTPDWLIDTAILNRTGETSMGIIGELQTKVLYGLTFLPNLAMMYSRNQVLNGDKVYKVRDFFEDLKNAVWKELKTHQVVNPYRRNLQKKYVTTMVEIFTSSKANIMANLRYTGFSNFYATDLTSIIYGQLSSLEKELSTSASIEKDKDTKDHYNYLIYKIKIYLSNYNNNITF